MGSCTSIEYSNSKFKIRPIENDRMMQVFYRLGNLNLHSSNSYLWELVIRQECYPLHELEKYKDQIDWELVSKYQKLTRPFITKYKNRIDFEALSRYNKYLSNEIILTFRDDLELGSVLKRRKTLSPELIIELLPDLDTYEVYQILKHKKLDENVLEMLNMNKYADHICKYQKISESFMMNYEHSLNWKLINRFQPLVLSFIEKRPDLINWHELSYNKYLTRDIAAKYKLKLKNTEEVERALLSS